MVKVQQNALNVIQQRCRHEFEAASCRQFMRTLRESQTVGKQFLQLGIKCNCQEVLQTQSGRISRDVSDTMLLVARIYSGPNEPGCKLKRSGPMLGLGGTSRWTRLRVRLGAY